MLKTIITIAAYLIPFAVAALGHWREVGFAFCVLGIALLGLFILTYARAVFVLTRK